MNSRATYLANAIGALGDLLVYSLAPKDVDSREDYYPGADAADECEKVCDQPSTIVGGSQSCGPIAAMEDEEREWRDYQRARDNVNSRMECLRITGGNLDRAAAVWDFATNSGPRPNLGLASNYDLIRELDARHGMGHTEPTYRSIDPEPEVVAARVRAGCDEKRYV